MAIRWPSALALVFVNGVIFLLHLMAMPLTFSISTGLGLGLIAAVTIAWASGKAKGNLTPFTWGLAVVFLFHFLEPLLFRTLGR